MSVPSGTTFERIYQGDEFADQFAGANRASRYNSNTSYADYEFYGEESGDTLLGGHGDDLMYGDSGNDLMSGGYGFNTLYGGTGIDTVSYAYFGANTVHTPTTLGVQVDLSTAEAFSRDTRLEMEEDVFSFDNIVGSNRSDRLYGSSISNDIEGGRGNDLLSGRSGNDFLDGGTGADSVYGGSGNDDMFGGSSEDYLSGGNGNDDMNGESSGDKLYGGLGADDIIGGTGADDFIYRSIAESTVSTSGRDVIRGFNHDAFDAVDLTAIDANTDVSGNNAFDFIGRLSFSGDAGELRYRYGSTYTVLEADTNGNGVADFAITFTGLIAFQDGDIFL
jgi:serralysin